MPLSLSALLAQQVEYLHGKQKVTGSSPVEGYASSEADSSEADSSEADSSEADSSEADVRASEQKFDTKGSFMVSFRGTNEASPSGKAAGFDPAIQRFESFRLRKRVKRRETL